LLFYVGRELYVGVIEKQGVIVFILLLQEIYTCRVHLIHQEIIQVNTTGLWIKQAMPFNALQEITYE
jgi:hypothetical protein